MQLQKLQVTGSVDYMRGMQMKELNFRKRRRKKSLKKRKRMNPNNINAKEIVRWGIEIVAICILAFTLVFFFGQRVSNAGDAMSPALKNGDVVLVNRLVYNVKKPVRGEIVVFKPKGNENAHYSVKRIVGLPGEKVQIQEGQVYINDEILVKDIYSYDIKDAGLASEPIKLGNDEYFVLGDNNESSNDSRVADVGNVSREDIFGKVWFVTNFGEDFGFVSK